MAKITDLRWHTCTTESPWKPELEKRGIHPEAHEVGAQEDGYPGGDIVTMKCPICGVSWRQELPQ